jgi:hypothetical protein
MNGKDYVTNAKEIAEKVISEGRALDSISGDPLLEEISKACEMLENLKKKPTLRTKNGTNLAFPVMEAAENLDEAWEDAAGENSSDLQWRLEEFAGAVNALNAALKERTVIMT